MEHNTINNMKKALLIVCLFISVIASGQGNFFWSHNSEYRLGYLYNWYVATDSRNISNTGWHVPTHDECLALQDYSVSALKLKKYKHCLLDVNRWN